MGLFVIHLPRPVAPSAPAHRTHPGQAGGEERQGHRLRRHPQIVLLKAVATDELLAHPDPGNVGPARGGEGVGDCAGYVLEDHRVTGDRLDPALPVERGASRIGGAPGVDASGELSPDRLPGRVGAFDVPSDLGSPATRRVTEVDAAGTGHRQRLGGSTRCRDVGAPEHPVPGAAPGVQVAPVLDGHRDDVAAPRLPDCGDAGAGAGAEGRPTAAVEVRRMEAGGVQGQGQGQKEERVSKRG